MNDIIHVAGKAVWGMNQNKIVYNMRWRMMEWKRSNDDDNNNKKQVFLTWGV